MTHRERFFSTIYREKIRKPACWLGLPDDSALPKFCDYFNVADIQALKSRIDDDIYPIDLPYNSPNGNSINTALNFRKTDYLDHTSGVFKNCEDPDEIAVFPWPDPADHINREDCLSRVKQAPRDYALLGLAWSRNFEDACTAFGMEMTPVRMIMKPDIFKVVFGRITEFYLRANEIFYDSTQGFLDAVFLGNDLGGQQGLMLSTDLIRSMVLPGVKKLIDQAKSFGLKVIYHSCGSIYEIIPDMIHLGIDAVHPMQTHVTNMAPQKLKEDFGTQISFCGGIDADNLMVNGTPSQIRKKVQSLTEIFPSGLIISPSVRFISPDTPPQNIKALFGAVGDLVK